METRTRLFDIAFAGTATLDAFTQYGSAPAARRFVWTTETRTRLFDIAFAGAATLDAFTQRLLDVHPGSAAKAHQIQQRVTAQAVGPMDRHTGHLTARVQTFDNNVITVGILRQSLGMNVGWNTTHHIVTGRHHRNRVSDRIHVGERPGQFADTRQAAL